MIEATIHLFALCGGSFNSCGVDTYAVIFNVLLHNCRFALRFETNTLPSQYVRTRPAHD